MKFTIEIMNIDTVRIQLMKPQSKKSYEYLWADFWCLNNAEVFSGPLLPLILNWPQLSQPKHEQTDHLQQSLLFQWTSV